MGAGLNVGEGLGKGTRLGSTVGEGGEACIGARAGVGDRLGRALNTVILGVQDVRVPGCCLKALSTTRTHSPIGSSPQCRTLVNWAWMVSVLAVWLITTTVGRIPSTLTAAGTKRSQCLQRGDTDVQTCLRPG